eukprot:g9014.t1
MEPMFQILGLNRLFCNKPPRETSALDPGFVIYRGVGGVNTPSGVFGDHSNMVPHAWKGVSVSLTSHDFLQQQVRLENWEGRWRCMSVKLGWLVVCSHQPGQRVRGA